MTTWRRRHKREMTEEVGKKTLALPLKEKDDAAAA
jgi:hypothetical protein